MISTDKKAEIYELLLKMQTSQMRLVALLASERMWMSFAENLNFQYKNPLDKNVRICLDLIWDKVLQGTATEEQLKKYKDTLDIINNTVDDVGTKEEFLAPYPLYLIDQLFSGIYSVDDSQIAEICSGATVRVLDMICDDILDHIVDIDDNTIKQHIAVLNELKRIDNDIALSKQFPQNIHKIKELRAKYQNLCVVPVASDVV